MSTGRLCLGGNLRLNCAADSVREALGEVRVDLSATVLTRSFLSLAEDSSASF